jgi:hypothetical protein
MCRCNLFHVFSVSCILLVSILIVVSHVPLTGGLKRKYGRAPEVLLRAPRPKNLPKSPKEWGRKKMMAWVKKTLLVYATTQSDKQNVEEKEENEHKAENETVEVSYDLSESFHLTGSQMYSLSVHDVIRRCGGGSSCAGFNSEENPLYDASQQQQIAQAAKMEKEKRQRLESCGRYVHEQFRLLVLADKKRH